MIKVCLQSERNWLFFDVRFQIKSVYIIWTNSSFDIPSGTPHASIVSGFSIEELKDVRFNSRDINGGHDIKAFHEGRVVQKLFVLWHLI